MIPYIMDYLRTYVNPNLSDKDAIWLSALGFCTQGFSMPAGGLVAKKVGFRIVVATSCIFLSGSVFATYFTIQKTFVGVVITYSLTMGIGMGFAYSVVFAGFPEKRGLIVGIIVSGFGLGALVFSPIQTALINPTNVKVDNVTRHFTDVELLDRVPRTLLILGGILLGIQIIGFILLRPRPSSKQQFGQKYISDDRFLSAIVTVSSLFNCAGRVMWGSIADRFSFKVPLCVKLTIWSVVLMTFPHLSLFSETVIKILFPIWVFVLFTLFCGTLVLIPNATGTVFGPVNLAVNYGLIFLAFHSMQGDGTIAGCFSVLGGYLIHLSYGYLYSLTNMVPYIMGYLITFIDPHICVQTSVWFSAVTFAVYGIFMPLGGFLSRKIGYRPVLALSCLFLSGGVLLSYFTIQKTYVGVILTYSFLFGTGVGLGFSVTLAVGFLNIEALWLDWWLVDMVWDHWCSAATCISCYWGYSISYSDHWSDLTARLFRHIDFYLLWCSISCSSLIFLTYQRLVPLSKVVYIVFSYLVSRLSVTIST
ncbi:putative hypothetical protein [Schistosoma mansoni]|uniref:putative hypothetical protein n=1 Tax=Schistosoma mansoni TaxID=6183 RepID=UPI00022DCA36|nr:putative hypothetical protein [Schistosoma mansoni]|eukprot:XP_018654070.1 putative hypothetical protein [Schistosoma mansoni]